MLNLLTSLFWGLLNISDFCSSTCGKTIFSSIIIWPHLLIFFSNNFSSLLRLTSLECTSSHNSPLLLIVGLRALEDFIYVPIEINDIYLFVGLERLAKLLENFINFGDSEISQVALWLISRIRRWVYTTITNTKRLGALVLVLFNIFFFDYKYRI